MLDSGSACAEHGSQNKRSEAGECFRCCIARLESNGPQPSDTEFTCNKGTGPRHADLILYRICTRWVNHIIPRPCCSLRSSQTVFPEQEHTVLSLSQTPALRAITPTKVSGSFWVKEPSASFDTTMLRPMTSQMAKGLSRKAFPFPSFPTLISPKEPRAFLKPAAVFRASQILPVDMAPCDISPLSRMVA